MVTTFMPGSVDRIRYMYVSISHYCYQWPCPIGYLNRSKVSLVIPFAPFSSLISNYQMLMIDEVNL